MLASCFICFVEFIKLVSVVEVFEVSRGWIGVLVFLVFEASRGWIGVLVFRCSRCPELGLAFSFFLAFVFGVRGVRGGGVHLSLSLVFEVSRGWIGVLFFLEARRGLFRSSPRLREGRCAAGSFRGALSSRGALSFEDPDSIDAHLVRVSFNLI